MCVHAICQSWKGAGRLKALPDSQAQVTAVVFAQGQQTVQCKVVHHLSTDTHTTGALQGKQDQAQLAQADNSNWCADR